MSSSLCGCHCLRIEKSCGSRRDLSGGSSDPGFGSKEKFIKNPWNDDKIDKAYIKKWCFAKQTYKNGGSKDFQAFFLKSPGDMLVFRLNWDHEFRRWILANGPEASKSLRYWFGKICFWTRLPRAKFKISLGGWQVSEYFRNLHPEIWGRWTHFDFCIFFQRGGKQPPTRYLNMHDT